MTDFGFIPSSGAFGTDWPNNLVIPQGREGSISSAGWTEGNEGFPQQTFLGASLRSFNVNAGFGDSSSTLSVDLVNDEYNKSDGLGVGLGDDVYHGGDTDVFSPPVVGTPVFFKFGKNFADVEQAYRKTIDDLYGYSTVPAVIDFPTVTTKGDIKSIPEEGYYLRSSTGDGDSQVNTWVDKSSLSDSTNSWRGKDHFVFAGILQSYTENKSEGGTLYSVNVTDPREILSNAVVLLNNYQGTTFNNKNLFNVYGFLEYDPSDELLEILEGTEELPNTELIEKSILTKNVDDLGNVVYLGNDTYNYVTRAFNISNYPDVFPITGQGFSRRSDQGIPWYRVNQGLTALFNYNGSLPDEYINAGFGGTIDFRGYKYVVDFSGIPLERIPQMYFIDFDQIDMLSLAQELCDVISHDLFVSLLPVVDHPAYSWLYNYNTYQLNNNNASNIIAGVIRVDAIDRSVQPNYGTIKAYIDSLSDNGVDVQNQDLGFELSNVVTDKFVVGAQETNMYYFTNNKDRNNTQLRRKNDGLENDYELMEEIQWDIDTSLKQQILPFYGFLGKNAVTIPRGFGSYQQIMLDTSALFANGVGNYYVTTELELRIALKSYADWAKFLSDYSELYIEDLSNDKEFYKAFNSDTPDNTALQRVKDLLIKQKTEAQNGSYTGGSQYLQSAIDNLSEIENKEYGVTVPRCVFNSDKNFMGEDGYPASPCSPPYGYPLYYKRAEKIGIARGGIISFAQAQTEVSSNLEKLRGRLKEKLSNDGVIFNDDDLIEKTRKQIDNLSAELIKGTSSTIKESLGSNIEYIDGWITEYDELVGGITKIKDTLDTNAHLIKGIKNIGLDGYDNSKKVYEFIKKVAEENLGKKFLVKIPNYCNLNYDENITYSTTNNQPPHGFDVEKGPFGFKPKPINYDSGFSETLDFKNQISFLMLSNLTPTYTGSFITGYMELFSHYLDEDADGKYTYGALKSNYNPISEKWEFNYQPNNDGGFFDFALFDRNLSFTESLSLDDARLPLATQQMFAPRDLTNLVETNGRIKCYVRYENSEFLDLSSVSKDRVVQEIVEAEGLVPDILEELDNVNTNTRFSLDRIKELFKGDYVLPKSIAFVSCEVDPQFYMPPKTQSSGIVSVYGRTIKWVENAQPIKLVEAKGDDGCLTLEPSSPEFLKLFSPGDNGGKDSTKVINKEFVRYYNFDLDADIIDTEISNLDNEHVYALITIPGRITSSLDSRYVDSFAYKNDPQAIKHNLTQDVVRGPEGFDQPAPLVLKSEAKFGTDCLSAPKFISQISYARKIQQQAMDRAGGGNLVSNVSQSQPSPIYPDIVAIPLTSMERCYGPWLSSAIEDNRARYSDIGGKIEFVKDENLAPWNYAGYQLLNEAGKLQAQFSNSLLLFSERGGFVIPEVPTGIALATALQNTGPLVTSISVDINQNISTTVRMDLYTASFGKLQKQKELAIASITRERQKIIDQNNAMIRNGFGKNITNVDSLAPIRGVGGTLVELARDSSDFIVQNNVIQFVAEQNRRPQIGIDSESEKSTKTTVQAATTTPEQVLTSSKDADTAQARNLKRRSLTVHPTDTTAIVSNSPNRHVPAVPYVNEPGVDEMLRDLWDFVHTR